MTDATFQVAVTEADARAFATLSGDWNPLHTDPAHAARTAYGRPVLHGAFAAGLMSRMAGMYLPGTDCLLHSLRLRFVAPIVPPATLTVRGQLVGTGAGDVGRVDVTISDASTGTRYVDGVYEFGRHTVDAPSLTTRPTLAVGPAPILVTGATGGLGRAVLERLGARGLGLSRSPHDGLAHVPDLARVAESLPDGKIGGIVHCAWPSPDNEALIALDDPARAIEHHLAGPVAQAIALARLLMERGVDDAMLVLIGSTAAAPGRHNYRMPLYSLAKSLVPDLTRILALELAPSTRRCAAIVFDVVEAGMNARISAGARIAHADRSPFGRLATAAEAAAQVAWVLDNAGFLASGATLTLTGAAAP